MGNTKLFNLSVGQYQLLTEIDTELSPIEQNIYAVAAIKGVSYEEASKIKLKEFRQIMEAVEAVSPNALKRLKIDNTIILNGEQYHIEHKPDKLTSGQLLDVISTRSQYKGEAVGAMHLLLAAIIRPKGKSYGEDDLTLNERAALIKGVKLHKVWNVFVFFWNLWNDSLQGTEDSLNKQMDLMPTEVHQILANDGDSSA
jgi:hypothetical protein